MYRSIPHAHCINDGCTSAPPSSDTGPRGVNNSPSPKTGTRAHEKRNKQAPAGEEPDEMHNTNPIKTRKHHDPQGGEGGIFNKCSCESNPGGRPVKPSGRRAPPGKARRQHRGSAHPPRTDGENHTRHSSRYTTPSHSGRGTLLVERGPLSLEGSIATPRACRAAIALTPFSSGPHPMAQSQPRRRKRTHGTSGQARARARARRAGDPPRRRDRPTLTSTSGTSKPRAHRLTRTCTVTAP